MNEQKGEISGTILHKRASQGNKTLKPSWAHDRGSVTKDQVATWDYQMIKDMQL